MKTYQELRKLSKDQLIQEYDNKAVHTEPGLDFYKEEIARRDAEEQTKQMMRINNQMRIMTIIITILTIINVIAVFISLFKSP